MNTSTCPDQFGTFDFRRRASSATIFSLFGVIFFEKSARLVRPMRVDSPYRGSSLRLHTLVWCGLAGIPWGHVLNGAPRQKYENQPSALPFSVSCRRSRPHNTSIWSTTVDIALAHLLPDLGNRRRWESSREPCQSPTITPAHSASLLYIGRSARLLLGYLYVYRRRFLVFVRENIYIFKTGAVKDRKTAILNDHVYPVHRCVGPL